MKQLLGQLFIALAIAGVAVVAYLYKPLVEQYLAQQREASCMQSYQLQYTDTNNNTVVVSPNMDEVELCIGGR
jgi:hypothetical protein